MSAFSDELTTVELPELPLATRPVSSSSSCSIFSVQADSMAANARIVEEYLSSLELFESQDPPQPALPATAPETALPGMDVPGVAVSTSSQTDQKDEQQDGEAQTESPALEEPSEHPEPRKELEQRDEEAQTESPLVQDSKETQTVEEPLEAPDMQPENQSQPVDEPAVELQEAQTQTENQTAQDSKETQTTCEEHADLEHPDVAASVAMEETLEVDADVPAALATSGNSTVKAASPAEESAWMTRVHQLRERESPVHLAPSRPDPNVVAKLLGIDPHRAAHRGPTVPPLDFGKVQMGEVGIYDFSASMSKARSETCASSDGRLGPATDFTEPVALSSSTVEELTPEERYQLFVRRIRQKHLGTPKVSPFARPLTLPPLKDHFAFKKKRKSPSQSYFSPGDVIGMPMEEQLHSHFHHHFHLRNDLPAISEES